MRLNPDCIRATLFYIESHLQMKDGFSNDLPSEKIVTGLKESFDADDIRYSIKYLCESYYLDCVKFKTHNYLCIVNDITPRGHTFINNVRNDDAWDKTKEIAEKNKSFSLEMLGQIANAIAGSIAQAAIKAMTEI